MTEFSANAGLVLKCAHCDRVFVVVLAVSIASSRLAQAVIGTADLCEWHVLSCRAAESRHDGRYCTGNVLSIVGVHERERCVVTVLYSVLLGTGMRLRCRADSLGWDGRRRRIPGREKLLLGVVLVWCCADGRLGRGVGVCSA